jgi:hypothetical protein
MGLSLAFPKFNEKNIFESEDDSKLGNRFDKDASRTGNCCVAQSAPHCAARRSFAAQKSLAQDDTEA